MPPLDDCHSLSQPRSWMFPDSILFVTKPVLISIFVQTMIGDPDVLNERCTEKTPSAKKRRRGVPDVEDE